jgi:HEAT repeat protein
MSSDPAHIPTDSSGRPDSSYLTHSAQHYAAMHEAALGSTAHDEARMAFNQRVIATWGLIARGAEAVPYALAMLKSANPEAREDGAAILAEIGRSESTVGQLLKALAVETEPQARDSLVLTLGALRNRAAIPALVEIIEDEGADGDTRWCAVECLGKIVRRRFLDRDDPYASARDWIDRDRARKR